MNRSRSRYSTPRVSRWMALRYAGTCHVCGSRVAAGQTGYYDQTTRDITCSAMTCAQVDGLTRDEWHGSPTTGAWLPVLSDRRIGAPATTWKQRYGRCEDAPCCGCCDA